MAEFLVGIWLNNLFSYSMLMVNTKVNLGALWLCRNVFEHLMSLRKLDVDTYNAFNTTLKDEMWQISDVDDPEELDSCSSKAPVFNVSLVNKWLEAHFNEVVNFYNDLVNVGTDSLYKGVEEESFFVRELHLEFK